MRIKSLIFILATSWLFFGCATPQQLVHFPDSKTVVEDTSKGRIYVIRPGWTGIGISTDISVDGEIIGSTGPESYLCWEQEPGNITISAKADNVSEVEINVLAGQAKYIIQKLHFGWITTDNQLTVVSEAEGKEALKKCKPPTADTITNNLTDWVMIYGISLHDHGPDNTKLLDSRRNQTAQTEQSSKPVKKHHI